MRVPRMSVGADADLLVPELFPVRPLLRSPTYHIRLWVWCFLSLLPFTLADSVLSAPSYAPPSHVQHKQENLLARVPTHSAGEGNKNKLVGRHDEDLADALDKEVAGSAAQSGTSTEERKRAVCRLMFLAPIGDFVVGDEDDEFPEYDNRQYRPYCDGQTTPRENGRRAFSFLAAAEMAMEHLRTKDFHSIVSLFGDDDGALHCENDSLPFPDERPIDVYNGFNNGVIQQFAGSLETERRTTSSAAQHDHESISKISYVVDSESSVPPCALLGPFDDESITKWSLWSVVSETPLFSLGGTTSSPSLTDQSVVPFTFHGTVRVDDYARVVVEYLHHRKFVSILFDSNDYVSSMIVPHVEASAEEHGLTVKAHPFSQVIPTSSKSNDTATATSPSDIGVNGIAATQEGISDDQKRHWRNNGIEQALQRIKYCGYHTILVSVRQRATYFDEIATVADRLGLLGPEYLWIFTSTTIRHVDSLLPRQVPNSATDKLLRGSGVIHLVDKFDVHSKKANKELQEEDAFLINWKKQDASILERVRSQMEVFNHTNEYYQPPLDENYFETNLPAPFSSFVYDVTVAAGLSLCRTVRSPEADDDSGLQHVPMPIKDIVSEILKTSFDGASGRMRFDSEHMGRLLDDVTFGAYNIRPEDEIDYSDGKRGYRMVVASTRGGNGWHAREDDRFLFFDGTANEPTLLRDVANAHYVPDGARAVVLTCVWSLVICSVVAAIIFVIYRHDPVTQSANLPFLVLFCLGTALKTGILYAMSQDESHGWTDRELSRMCYVRAWIFPVGSQIVDVAILIKARQLLQLTGDSSSSGSRNAMVINACTRFASLSAFLLTATICLHIYANTREWTRQVLVDFPLETVGVCHDHEIPVRGMGSSYLLYVLTVFFLAQKLVAMGALLQSCNNLAKLSSDEKGCLRWIVWGISVRTQAVFVGAPVFFMLDYTSPEEKYTGAASVLLAFGACAFGLIAGSVIYRLLMKAVLVSPPSIPAAESSFLSEPSQPTLNEKVSTASLASSSLFRGPSEFASTRGSYSLSASDKNHRTDPYRRSTRSPIRKKVQPSPTPVTPRSCVNTGREEELITHHHCAGVSHPGSENRNRTVHGLRQSSRPVSGSSDEGFSESERMLVAARRKLQELEHEVMTLHVSKL